MKCLDDTCGRNKMGEWKGERKEGREEGGMTEQDSV